jgi:hypothetical protein
MTGVPLPRYTPQIIASCPACSADLIDEAFTYWCPECRRSWSGCEVAYFDEGLPDD